MTAHEPRAVRVGASAPIRICDTGGWTDTWFAGHGCVFHIAVRPTVDVELGIRPRSDREPRVVLDVATFGERYGFELDNPPGRHPLLEATVDEIGLPDDVSVDVRIESDAPPGSSTGTSASATVALVGALDHLTPGRYTRREVARTAHRVEVDRVGRESGIQDQLCAAFGGVNFIEIPGYPDARVMPLEVPDAFASELERRLLVVYLGGPHASSDVHARVIEHLAGGSGGHELESLRACARRSRVAFESQDLPGLGRAMEDNTDVQRRLHPDLVDDDAEQVLELAAAHGALGSKVNGAGGEGGSLTVLFGPDLDGGPAFIRALRGCLPAADAVPVELDRHGLRTWQARR